MNNQQFGAAVRYVAKDVLRKYSQYSNYELSRLFPPSFGLPVSDGMYLVVPSDACRNFIVSVSDSLVGNSQFLGVDLLKNFEMDIKRLYDLLSELHRRLSQTTKSEDEYIRAKDACFELIYWIGQRFRDYHADGMSRQWNVRCQQVTALNKISDLLEQYGLRIQYDGYGNPDLLFCRRKLIKKLLLSECAKLLSVEILRLYGAELKTSSDSEATLVFPKNTEVGKLICASSDSEEYCQVDPYVEDNDDTPSKDDDDPNSNSSEP